MAFNICINMENELEGLFQWRSTVTHKYIRDAWCRSPIQRTFRIKHIYRNSIVYTHELFLVLHIGFLYTAQHNNDETLIIIVCHHFEADIRLHSFYFHSSILILVGFFCFMSHEPSTIHSKHSAHFIDVWVCNTSSYLAFSIPLTPSSLCVLVFFYFFIFYSKTGL